MSILFVVQCLCAHTKLVYQARPSLTLSHFSGGWEMGWLDRLTHKTEMVGWKKNGAKNYYLFLWKYVHVPVVYFGQQQTYTCRNTVLACCRPRLWQSWHYLLVCSCFTTKPAGDLVVSSTILETQWWKLWYVLCLPANLTHIAGCHPTKTCPYQLIAGCVLTLAHNNMAFWTSLVEMGMFVVLCFSATYESSCLRLLHQRMLLTCAI